MPPKDNSELYPFKNTRASTVLIPASTATRIVGKNPNRTLLVLVNLSQTVPIYLGVDNSVTSLSGSNPGYTIQPTAAIDNGTYRGEIWVYVDLLVNVSIWEESR